MDAADSKPSISDTATRTVEGGFRSLLRGNRPSPNTPVTGEDALAAGTASIAEIENLMAELLVARDYLQAEGERVRRLNANYAHLAQTASASVKVIAESMSKWRLPKQDSSHAVSAAGSRTHVSALKLADQEESKQEALAS